MLWKVDLHVHTLCSPDSLSSFDAVLEASPAEGSIR